MKQIFVIREREELITARDTMENAVAAAMNRLAICGYLCESFSYDDIVTVIEYRDLAAHETRLMIIEELGYKEGV